MMTKGSVQCEDTTIPNVSKQREVKLLKETWTSPLHQGLPALLCVLGLLAVQELTLTVPVPAWHSHVSPQTAGYTLLFKCAWTSHQVGQQSPESAPAPLLKLLSVPGGAHSQASGFPGPRAPGNVCLMIPVLPEGWGTWVSWGPPSVPPTSPMRTCSASPPFTTSTLAPGRLPPPPAPWPVREPPPPGPWRHTASPSAGPRRGTEGEALWGDWKSVLTVHWKD